MFMTPIYINELLPLLQRMYGRMKNPSFDYHKMDKKTQEKYHEMIAYCESIVETSFGLSQEDSSFGVPDKKFLEILSSGKIIKQIEK